MSVTVCFQVAVSTRSRSRLSIELRHAHDYAFFHPEKQQLEDDVVPARHWVARAWSCITAYSDRQPYWRRLDLSKLGFVGKVFPTRILARLVDYFAKNYFISPVDWMMNWVWAYS